MSKYLFLFIITLFALPTIYNVQAQGFLKTDGHHIVNGKGEKIILRGMGLGGWMLQEGYMFQLGNIGQQHRIRQKIEELVGKERTAQFYDAWLTHHTTKTDIDSMAAWGFNSIRLPMHYNLYTLPVDEEPVKGAHTWLEKGFDLTDSLLSWCRQNQLYLFLDLHAAPGGQGNDLAISDRDPTKPSLWESEANQQKTIALWRKLAERYAGEAWIGGYDIINEPNWGFEDSADFRGIAENKNEPLKKLMVDITRAIREVDKQHIIIIEGNGFGNNYRGILPTWDDNMVISFHKYGNFNNVNAIQSFLDLRTKYNAPLWLGESGENSNTWFTEAIELVEKHGIGWAWWQEKKMGINNPLEIKKPEGYQLLLDYWSGKGTKPSPDTSWRILQDWLQNLKIENNIFHPDVIDAMFRQVQSKEAIPFKHHALDKMLSIPAVHFDMGRQRSAYFDWDSASYQYTPGVNTRGNRGRLFRNDGVDITGSNNDYNVFATEDSEWLQYSIDAQVAGNYVVMVSVASDSTGGKLSIMNNGLKILSPVAIENTGGAASWKEIRVGKIVFKKGLNQFRLMIEKGGFHIKEIRLMKEN